MLRGSVDNICVKKDNVSEISATNSYSQLSHFPSSFRKPQINSKKSRFSKSVIEIHDLCLHIIRLLVWFFRNDTSDNAVFIVYKVIEGI